MTTQAQSDEKLRQLARGFRVEDLESELNECLRTQKALVAQLSLALPQSKLWDIIAGTCDELSDWIGVLKEELDTRL